MAHPRRFQIPSLVPPRTWGGRFRIWVRHIATSRAVVAGLRRGARGRRREGGGVVAHAQDGSEHNSLAALAVLDLSPVHPLHAPAPQAGPARSRRLQKPRNYEDQESRLTPGFFCRCGGGGNVRLRPKALGAPSARSVKGLSNTSRSSSSFRKSRVSASSIHSWSM